MNDEHKDPEQLEREVESARTRVGRTVNALGNKLSPNELLDQAMHLMSDHGGEFASNLGRQVKHNPLALLMTGVGVMWLAAGSNTRSKDSRSNGSRHFFDAHNLDGHNDATHSSGNGSTTIKQKVSAAGDKVKDAKNSGLDSLQAGKEQAVQTAEELSGQLQTAFRQHPLIVGGLGVALGAALGALLPPSDAEDRMLGDVSDKLTHKAAREAEKQYDQVREKVKDVAGTVKESAQARQHISSTFES